MADAGRTGVWQLVLLLVTIAAIEDSTVIDHLLAHGVGQDAWLSIVLAAPLVVVGLWPIVALGRRYPGKDLMGMLRASLGPLAYPVALVYAGAFVADSAISLRAFGVLGRLLGFMELTPYTAIVLPLAVLAVYACVLGIEVLARVNAFLLLAVDIPLGLALTVLSANHQHLARALPVLAHGLMPVAWGTWLIVGKFGAFALLLVFLPLVADQHRVRLRGALVLGVLGVAVMALGHTMGAVLTFDSSVHTVMWPTYSQLRSIEMARFISNLDWLGVVLWTHGFLVETAAFLYGASLLLASLAGTPSYRPFVLPLGAVAFTLSYFAGRTEQAMFDLRWGLDAFVFVLLAWVIPPLLLGVTWLRQRRGAGPARAGAGSHRPAGSGGG